MDLIYKLLKITIVFSNALYCFQLQGQQFNIKLVINALEINDPKGMWGDFNNDGSLDVLVVGVNEVGDIQAQILINKEGNDFEQLELDLGDVSKGIFEVIDIDNDNKLDIVYSGSGEDGKPLTTIYKNTGDFSFEPIPNPVANIAAEVLAIHDLNNDGKKDILLSGQNESDELVFKALMNKGTVWQTLEELPIPGLLNAQLKTLDFNNDGLVDFLVSGNPNDGGYYNRLMLSKTEGGFEPLEMPLETLIKGSGTIGDYNSDGKTDLLLTGIDSQGGKQSILYLWEDQEWKESPMSLPGVSSSCLLLADLNSDGLADIVLNGINEEGEGINEIIINNDTEGYTSYPNVLNKNKVLWQGFGDYDYDGDLDLVQFVGEEGNWDFELYENITEEENFCPQSPASHAAFNTFDGVKIVWESNEDDLTAKESITHDIFIGKSDSTAEVLSPGFDLTNLQRLISWHGNQFYSQQLLVKSLDNGGIYDYGIEAVDNAFYSLCSGCKNGGPSGDIARGEFIVCDDPKKQELTACKGESVTLSISGQDSVAWYSQNEGYLGISSRLKFRAQQADSIFASVPGLLDCAFNKIFVIDLIEAPDFDFGGDVVVCSGDIVSYPVDRAWDEVTWQRASDGIASNSYDISFSVSGPDTLFIEVKSPKCTLRDSIIIDISEPILKLNGSMFKVTEGESVQLLATGEGTFQWQPSTGLNDDMIPNPVATPEVTTQYTVTLLDSLGCDAQAQVLIEVSQSAFVPTLFTPNNDGKNDYLKIYGLDNTSSFSFKIFDRSGNKVFESKDPQNIRQLGWDGKNRGIEQSNGVYYWKVSGEFVDGTPLTLNGKVSGAVHLLR